MTTVTLRILGENGQVVGTINSTKAALAGLGSTAQASNAQAARSARQHSSAIESLKGQVAGLIAGYIGLQGVMRLGRAADEYTNLTAKLRLAVGETGSLAKAQRDVFRIAQETSQGLSETATLYARLSTSLKGLGASQADVAGLTRTINQALVVSGASSAESASAILQLSQAFGSGRLAGEEFNAVNEAAPALITALAKSMGVPRGALKELAAEGKITSQELVKAFSGQEAAKIAAMAEQIPLTMSRAYQRLSNSLTKYIGEADQAYGVSSFLATIIDELAIQIDRAVPISIMLGGAIAAWKFAPAGAGAMSAAAGLKSLSGWLSVLSAAAAGFAFGTYLYNEFEVARKAGAVLVTAFFTITEAMKLQWQAMTTGLRIAWNSFADFVQERLASLLDKIVALSKIELPFGQKLDIPGVDRIEDFAKSLRDATNAGKENKELLDQLKKSATESATSVATMAKDMWDAAGASRESSKATEEATESTIKFTPAAEDAEEQAKKLAKAQKEAAQAANALRNEQADLAVLLGGPVAAEAVRLNETLARLDQVERDLVATGQATASNLEMVAQARRAYGNATAEAVDALLREQGAINQLQSSWAAEFNAIGQSEQARARHTVAMQFEQEMRQAIRTAQDAGLSVSDAEIQRLLNLARARGEAFAMQSEMAEQSRRVAEEYQRVWTGGIDRVTTAFADFVVGGIKKFSDFKDALKNILRQTLADLLAMILKNKLIIPIQTALMGGGAGGQLGGLLGGGTGGGGLFGSLGGGISGIFGSIFGSEGVIAQGVGFLAQGVGQLALTTGSSILGSLAGGLGQLASVAGPIGAVIAAASVVNSLTGGRLFGTSYKPTGSTSTLSLGPDGGIASASVSESRRRSLFRGTARRTRSVDPGDDAIQAAEQLFDAVRQTMRAAANALRGEAPAMLAAALRTVQEFDKEGKVKATKYFVDILGRTWEEANAEAAATRITAEGLIATIDSILGTTASAAAASAADATGDVIDAVTGEVISGSQRLGDTMGLITKAIGDAQGEASSIAERWRNDADALMDGAQMLLLAATDIRAGANLLGDGTLTNIADLIEDLANDGETLAAAYARVAGSTVLLEEALALSGVALDRTREELVRFAADISTAAGGLERAQQLWTTYFSAFYTEAERGAFALERARARAAVQFTDIGLTAADFEGAGGAQRFRQLFESMLPQLSADAVVEWLEAAEALGIVIDLTGEASEAIEGVAESFGSLRDLMATIDERLADFAPQTFTDRIASLNAEIDQLIKDAVALGATEEQLMRIRQLGQLELGAILDEQRAALEEYRSFINGFTDADAGLSDFQRTRQQVGRETADAIRRANELARAAGLQGAALEDLIVIEEAGARRIAEAALAVEASITSLAEQLDYFSTQAETAAETYSSDLGFAHWWTEQQRAIAEAPRIDPQRFGLATQLAAQARELAEFSGEGVLDILNRLRVPLDRLLTDLGVNLDQLGSSEVMDRFVAASRTLGVDVLDAARQLGTNVGDLADASSILNDAFERALGKLPDDMEAIIRPLLAAYETSGADGRSAARSALVEAVDALPPELRAALAPFLEEITTTAVAEQQLGQLEQSNRYLSSAAEDLTAIRTLLGNQQNSPNNPNKMASDHLAVARSQVALLDRIAKAVEGMERRMDADANRKLVGTT